MFDKWTRKRVQKLLELNDTYKQMIDSYKHRCGELESELVQVREERTKECEDISQTIAEYNEAIKSARQIVADYQKLMDDAQKTKAEYTKEFLEFKKTWNQ